jgi:hypothetical protein
MTKNEKLQAALDVLDKMDGHGIYDASTILQDLPADLHRAVPTYTPKETEDNIRRRGLGGTLNAAPEDVLAYGYTTARALAHALLAPEQLKHADQIMGRGSSFRTYQAAIQKELDSE